MGSTHRVCYGPFAEYGHMVQKTPCWMACNTLGQEKQRERVTSFKKTSILSFQGPIALFVFLQGVFGTI